MVVKIPHKKLMHFGSLSLAIECKILLCDNFSSALFIYLAPFSEGLIGCMILIKEFVSLITVAIEIGKRYFFQWSMKNALLKTWTLQMQTSTEKIELIG